MVLIHQQLPIINREHLQIQFIHQMLFEHTLEHMLLVRISLDQQAYHIQDLLHQCLLQQQLILQILQILIRGQQVIQPQIQLEGSSAPE